MGRGASFIEQSTAEQMRTLICKLFTCFFRIISAQLSEVVIPLDFLVFFDSGTADVENGGVMRNQRAERRIRIPGDSR